jgi:DNA-binding LytR/AlgR family response regulator
MKKLDYSKQIGQKIVITEKSEKSYMNMEDITHITCNGYVSTVHLINTKTTYSEAYLLKYFEKELKDFGFQRANDHTLVNKKHLSHSQTVNGKKYIYAHNIEIAVSKRNASAF